MAIVTEPPSAPPPPVDACDAVITDPPPPYPSRERRARPPPRRPRAQHARIQTSQHTHFSSTDTHSDYEALTSPYTGEEGWPTEDTPLIASDDRHEHHQGPSRARAYSHSSTVSGAPSLARTVISLFRTDNGVYLSDDSSDRHLSLPGDDGGSIRSSRQIGLFSKAAWKRYFRPMNRISYYRSLFHLTVINLPYGLAAWVYLFVFTVTGTTLLVALPLGAVLCFVDLLGARAFSRGELYLQTRFHAPLAHPPPYPPRPIFTRYRELTATELEAVAIQRPRSGLVRERSFYKNAYAMFTDPTSYQALFYFLVIKPAITLLVFIGLIAFGLPLFLLILPAPTVLRATRKIGIWQANVAVEGLYLAVR